MDVRKIVKNFVTSARHYLIPDRCAVCQKAVTVSDDSFCSQRCCLRYWAGYRKEAGGKICTYPGCGKDCYKDANKAIAFDFCGQTHAKQYKELVNQIARHGPSEPGRCRYPDCPKPCYIDSKAGVVLDFCGKMHATMYKELQRGGPVYSSTHQATRAGNSTSAGTIQNVTGPICFYNSNEKYYEFTNFYERPILIDNKNWNTSGHYFQAQKFVGTPYLERIRHMQRLQDAFDFSREPTLSQWLRSDWEKVKLSVMYKALLAKFSQHKDLKDLLLQTGNRELIEHTSNDSYWGDGGDGRGQNNLGKLLMRVRNVLRPQGHTHSVATDGEDVEMEAIYVPDIIDLTDTTSQVMVTGKEGGNKTSSVAVDEDYSGDGGGPGYIRESSGNGCSGICASNDDNEGNDPSYKDDDSRLDSELDWSVSEEQQLLQYPAEDRIDNPELDEAAKDKDASTMDLDSLPPTSVGDENIVSFVAGQKSEMPTCHKIENSDNPWS